MKESLKETLIPCLVIKTSWDKLSTVLGHGGRSIKLQGSTKGSDSLSLSRQTHTPGGFTLTTCQSFLVQLALGRPLWCKHLYLIIHLLLGGTNTAWRKAFSCHRWPRRIKRNGEKSQRNISNQTISAQHCMKNEWIFPSFGELHVNVLPWHYQDSNMWQ